MKKNPWKTAFFALAAAVAAIAVLLAFFLFVPDGHVPKQPRPGKTVDFHVETDKADLTALVNRFLQEKKMKEKVFLDNEVVFYGTVSVFSEKLGYTMTFEPEALKNGDLVLKQKSVSLGSIHLPVSYILKFVKTTYKLPEWVIIKPSEKLVYIQLQKMELENDARIKADKFDLKNNDISFTLSFPK
ncbi:hypothetical protein BpJC7_28730 [Weizmannia acidilactici]|uniref:DUF2140 family protein n=1 Tax=Weizmannia acidilactici TaxID=2607726 RepID=A0A5J4JLR1_9BACI|nr:YpmS family protein [Weizmannia acidilactici]GER65737.1 hypothetical protein BpJC4_02080 [Weizmannia acidilactici]GER71570.1 hypothetical protein BpJC7_28730 [Weizmannia acidilactici]GER72093.1 hypothetical protein BpPP18_01600 [Weizmannia acidilactici]